MAEKIKPMKKLQAFITPSIQIALDVASKAHKKQIRKGSGIPYITHPIRTAELVYHFKGLEEQIIIALLHNTLEDTKLKYDDIRDTFGVAIAMSVLELTSQNKERKKFNTKGNYLLTKMKAMNPNILFVKIADRIANITGLVEGRTNIEFKIKYLEETKLIIEGLDSIMRAFLLVFKETYSLEGMWRLLVATYKKEKALLDKLVEEDV